MKSWKEQLRDLKSALRESGRGKERGDEPRKIDFEPPSSWLAGWRPFDSEELACPKSRSAIRSFRHSRGARRQALGTTQQAGATGF